MTKLELLEDEAYRNNIEIIDYPFKSERIRGLYCDGTVALSKSIDTCTEKACILAEELGHYHTSTGNIIDQSSVGNRKQELHARTLAYNKMIGLIGIVNAYHRGCRTLYDIADYLEVTEEFLAEALQQYKSKYGTHTTIDHYVIYFEPSLGVFELI